MNIFRIDNNICLSCIRTEIQPHVQRRNYVIVHYPKAIHIEKVSSSIHTDTVHPNSAGSFHKNSEIQLYLEYLKIDKSSLELTLTRFSLDTTLETVIKHLIKEHKLPISYRDITLTQIKTDHRIIYHIDYTFSTTLRQLPINPYTTLRFEYRAHKNIEENSLTTQTSAIISPSLSITVVYSKAVEYFDYTLPYDATVQYLFLDVIKRFNLSSIDPCRLQLKTTDCELNIKDFADKKLIDLNIGTKHRLLNLFIQPEKSIINENHQNYTKNLML